MNLFEKIKPNCAVLFISHRLNTLKNVADEIYVLDSKTITHSGNHQKLIKSDNFYSDYFNTI
jgi:ATP-binding cassette subfamily B protein